MPAETFGQHADLPEALLGFCRLVRESGFRVGIQESHEVLRACGRIPLQRKRLLRDSLRTLLCSSRSEVEAFDPLFEAYWSTEPLPVKRSDRKRKINPLGVVTRESRSILTFLNAGDSREESIREDQEVSGASLQEALRKTDFSKVPMGQMEELERLTQRLSEQLSARLSRRMKPTVRSGPVSLRRTLRNSLQYGGEPLHLSHRTRKQRKPGLVVLLDISGSMDQYSLFFLRFLHALQQNFRRMDAFLFSTRLTPISEKLRVRQFPDSLRKLSEREEAWSSGTRIGECLHAFHEEHARPLLSRNTIVLLLSDGFDTGSPELLGQQMRRFHGRVRKVIWLNPMLGMQNYQPATAGMQAALPWVDAFLAAHNLESLLELEHAL